MSMTASQRSTRARAAAFARAAQYGPEITRPAFDARMRRLADRVDPDGTLPEPERQRRTYALLRSQMASLSLKAARAKTNRKAAPEVETGAATSEVQTNARPAA